MKFQRKIKEIVSKVIHSKNFHLLCKQILAQCSQDMICMLKKLPAWGGLNLLVDLMYVLEKFVNVMLL